MHPQDERKYLDLAARLAFRGVGRVEPNPMVGCVIVNDGQVVGMGHHRVFGGLHAEAEALADAARRGMEVRGATTYVTLEPCNAQGKQPPCSEALARAGIARVIYARRDPNPVKAGGAAWLREQGIECISQRELKNPSTTAAEPAAPFIKRVTTGLPWVMAKWAQASSGSLTQADDGSRWISGDPSRLRVHRIRSRVDAIVTGIGTVLTDDPLLTVRGIAKPRKNPARVVIDARYRLPLGSKLVETVAEAPVIVYGLEPSGDDMHELRAAGLRRAALRQAGVVVRTAPADGATPGRVDIERVLRSLMEESKAYTVMVEAGPMLLESCFKQGLVDMAIVYLAKTNVREDIYESPTPFARPGATWGLLRTPGTFLPARVKQVGDDAEVMMLRLDRMVD